MGTMPPLLMLLFCLAVTACAPAIETRLADLSTGAAKGESAAVASIYDVHSGSVTALGDWFRDRVEAALRKEGLTVKSRQEIGVIIDDRDSFGAGQREAELWKQAGTELLAAGSYAILPPASGGSGESRTARLTVKLLRAADGSIVRTLLTEDVPLPPDWARLAAIEKGNVYQKAVETIVDPSRRGGPRLAARFERTPACFPSGASGRVLVDSEPGSHIYLLNLAADRTATILYPNALLADQPLPSGRFEYPPREMARQLQLVFYPLNERETLREEIKVIASRQPLDFSFLPVPQNEVFAGARGGELRRVLELLKSSTGWSEQVLGYMVGPGCR